MTNKTRYITQGAVIAALYVALTHVANLIGLASGAVQIRLSEVLTVLPLFTPSAIPGLTIGCLLANLTTGCVPWDIFGGTMATLLGAVGTYALRKHPYFGCVPPILANTLIVPFVLAYAYHADGTIPFFMLTVGAGEVISCGALGTALTVALKKNSGMIKWS